MGKISAFVLDNGLNSLGIARSLGRHQIPVYVFGWENDRFAAKSHYSKSILLKDHSDDTVIHSLLEAATRLDHNPALFFTSDIFLKFVSRHYDVLSGHFLIQIPNHESIETVSNKKKFAEFVVQNNFPSPKTNIPNSLSDVIEIADTLKYPLVLKPSESYQWRKLGFKVVYIDNKDTLIDKWQSLQGTCDDILIQQFIEGPDELNYSYCAYRTPERGEVANICVNKIRLNPIHGGIGAFLQVVKDEEIEDIGSRILEELQYVGVGSVCFKKDATTGKPYIYEVNGRLPIWHSVTQMCGIDLPYIMYRDMIQSSIDVPVQVKKHGKWVSLQSDVNAFRQYHSQGELSFWNWLKSYRGLRMCAEFALDDWGPFWHCLKQLVPQRLKRIGKSQHII
jgi:D-aspartate ligase